MALIVFLRGINVGGHRRLRPTELAKQLSDYDVVNVGAAGTFIVRRPGPRTKFCTELLRRLPFEAQAVFCDSRDLLRLETDNPFTIEPALPGITRFVSVLAKPSKSPPNIPLDLPSTGEWLVRVLAAKDQFIFGEYRRHMKTIGYLGKIDKLFGAPVTTRNWNTILTILRILKASTTTSAR